MKIAIMGCGTVGAGVFDIIQHSPDVLFRGSRGEKCEVKYVLDIKEFEDPEISAAQVRDIDIIANDPEISLVVETMGGLHPAFEFCMKCLEKGKSVVTSNKLLVSAKAPELFAAAKAHNAAFRFGASVCGGIPVIRTMFYGLAANDITGFAGILNGTSNFVLTKMIKDGMPFAEALKLAQEKGYAEKDPTDDIEGFDAARKTAILCSVISGRHVYPEQIRTTGITAVESADVEYVNQIGAKIKLIGFGKKDETGGLFASVAPAVVLAEDPLAAVEGVFNAVKVYGSRVGEVMFYGPGAGRNATASAVVADILDCVRCPGFDSAYYWENGAENGVLYNEGYSFRFYVRLTSDDKNGAVAALRAQFPDMILLHKENAPGTEVALITGPVSERRLGEILSAAGARTEKIFRVL